MSVYTVVSPAELEAWLQRYAVGTLVELVPITAGIENTNYFVTTTRGAWVLTLYERLPAEDLPFYLNLMAHLAEAGVPCPPPVLPVVPPVGTTQLSPARQPAQPVSPLHPWLCVQVAPKAP